MSATAIITGNITKTPEVKTSKSGTTYSNFDVVNVFRGYNDEERKNFYRVTCFGDYAKMNLRQEDLVCVIGKLECSYKETDDDKVFLNLNITANSVELIAQGEEVSGDPGDDLPF